MKKTAGNPCGFSLLVGENYALVLRSKRLPQRTAKRKNFSEKTEHSVVLDQLRFLRFFRTKKLEFFEIKEILQIFRKKLAPLTLLLLLSFDRGGIL